MNSAYIAQEGTIDKAKKLDRYGLYDAYGDVFITEISLLDYAPDSDEVYLKYEDVIAMLGGGCLP